MGAYSPPRVDKLSVSWVAVNSRGANVWWWYDSRQIFEHTVTGEERSWEQMEIAWAGGETIVCEWLDEGDVGSHDFESEAVSKEDDDEDSLNEFLSWFKSDSRQ